MSVDINDSIATLFEKQKASGKIKTVEPMYYTVKDVMEILGVGRSKACAIIRQINIEVQKEGLMPMSKGHVSKVQFHKRFI